MIDLNPFDNIGRGLKSLGGEVVDLVKKLNPADDIHNWVEDRLDIFKIEFALWGLRKVRNGIVKLFDSIIESLTDELVELRKPRKDRKPEAEKANG